MDLSHQVNTIATINIFCTSNIIPSSILILHIIYYQLFRLIGCISLSLSLLHCRPLLIIIIIIIILQQKVLAPHKLREPNHRFWLAPMIKSPTSPRSSKIRNERRDLQKNNRCLASKMKRDKYCLILIIYYSLNLISHIQPSATNILIRYETVIQL